MNPLLFPPMLIKRALDDLGAIADAARRLSVLEEQVLVRIDRVERETLTRADTIVTDLAALRREMAPIGELTALRDDIAPLGEDMHAVRKAVDDLEPLIREVGAQLAALREDLAPLGELADKVPGVGS